MTQDTGYRLYGETLWISPYVFSSFVALHEKGIPFNVVEVDLAKGAHLQPRYRDASLVASFVRQHPRRLSGLASVNLARPTEAVREFRRCVRELGFRGLRIVP